MKMQRVFFGSSRDSLSIPRNKKGTTDTSPLSASSKTAATEEGFISDHVREDSSDHIRQEQAPYRVEEPKMYDLGAPIVSSSKQKKKTKSRSVSFSEAKIAYFPMELGDNPSCRNGLPVELGQEAIDTESIDIDLYEQLKSASGHTRSHDEMRMGFMQRRLILKR